MKKKIVTSPTLEEDQFKAIKVIHKVERKPESEYYCEK
jgi:hypothetical protein